MATEWMNDEVCLFKNQILRFIPTTLLPLSTVITHHHHHHVLHQIIIILHIMFKIKSFPTSNSSSQCSCLGVRSFKYADFLSKKNSQQIFYYFYTNYCLIATVHCPIHKYVLLRIVTPPQLLTWVCMHVFCPQSGHIWIFAFEIHNYISPTPPKTLSSHHWTSLNRNPNKITEIN